MTSAWMDGIAVMLRAARRGIRLALDDEEEQVVRSLIATVLIANEGRMLT